jgi:RNAse (barnase) inhibitor barstar
MGINNREERLQRDSMKKLVLLCQRNMDMVVEALHMEKGRNSLKNIIHRVIKTLIKIEEEFMKKFSNSYL